MGLRTKDERDYVGDVVDTHDGFVRVEHPGGTKVIPKSDIKEIHTPVRDAPKK